MRAFPASGPDPANSSLAPDTVLQGRYVIVRQLGRGGMGAVYEALDQRLGITVALKETLSTEEPLRKQFEHEARLLAGMQHPALPRVTDHFVEGDRAFLVMQFIGGVDLARIIAQQPGPFPRDQVIIWADQLLDALIYLHSRDRQVIHRDIKPHNLKLTGTGQIALLDFGLAKAQPSDPSATSSRAFFGYTRQYAPLEQIQDRRTDPRSDIYALGATLYHLLTGIKPPDALVRAAALENGEPDPLKSANKLHQAVGPQIAAILSKAMAQKPEDRYASASEFREALRRMGRVNDPVIRAVRSPVDTGVLGSAPAGETTILKMTMIESGRRIGPGVITAFLVVVFALAGGTFYGSQRWFRSAGKVTAPSADNAVTQRQPLAARKSERPRTNDNLGLPATLSATPPGKNFRSANDVPAGDRGSEKRNLVGVSSPQAAPRKSSSPINVPSVRLPSPEFREKVPSPFADARVPAFGSSSASPKVFRAPDGTQVVKYADGSTRVFRPGERSVQSSDGQQR